MTESCMRNYKGQLEYMAECGATSDVFPPWKHEKEKRIISIQTEVESALTGHRSACS